MLSKKFKNKIFNSDFLFVLIAIIFYGIYFIPNILFGKYYYDDFVISINLSAYKEFYDFGYFDFVKRSTVDFFNSGRLYGLYLTHYLIFYFTDNPHLYHMVKSIFSLVPILCFAYILKLLTNNNFNSRFLVVIMPCFFLILIEFDPIMNQGLSIQISAIYIALSTIFFIKSKQNSAKKYQILSYFFFFMAFFHYEIGLLVVFLNSVIAVYFQKNYEEKKSSIFEYAKSLILVNFRQLKYYNLMILIWLTAYFINYGLSKDVYGGIKFDLNFEKIFLVIINQLICIIPLGSWRYETAYFNNPQPYQIFLSLLISIMFFFLIKINLLKINIIKCRRELITLGLGLAFIPALMLSFSKFYQFLILSNEFPKAFVQVYLQYIGMGILILVFCEKILSNSRQYNSDLKHKILVNFLAFIISTIIGFSHLNNYSTIEKKNIFYNDYLSIKKALNLGIMKDLEGNFDKSKADYENDSAYSYFDKLELVDNKFQISKKYQNDLILVSNLRFFFAKQFFLGASNTSFRVFSIENNEKNHEIAKKGIDFKNHFYIEDGVVNYNYLTQFYKKQNLDGYVIFGKLNNIKVFKESSKETFLYELWSPKIFINKEYLFRFDKIISRLDQRFQINYFSKNQDELRRKLQESQDGIIVELKGEFNLIHPKLLTIRND